MEIDVVARMGPVIAIVEVRCRAAGAWVRAMNSVEWRKRARVRKAGEVLWKKRFQKDKALERMRFDVLSVMFDERGVATFEHAIAVF